MKHNPVAKFAHKVNKATVQSDRTKYHRNQKHRGEVRDDRNRPFFGLVSVGQAHTMTIPAGLFRIPCSLP